MPKNSNDTPGDIEQAILAGDYQKALQAVGVKVARTLDRCESTRDIRPLVGALFETMDKMHQYNLVGTNGKTPLDDILEEAERILANPGGDVQAEGK